MGVTRNVRCKFVAMEKYKALRRVMMGLITVT
jgi:hypothetical protein